MPTDWGLKWLWRNWNNFLLKQMEILEIELLTNDIEGTLGFYAEILGLQIISRNKDWVSFAAGATKLTFRFSKTEKPIYHFAFDIPNNQLLEAFA